MGFLSETAKAAAAGRTVRMTQLVFLDFVSVPMRVHPGFGPIVAADQTWDGLGGLGGITGLETAFDGSAPEITLTLSGVDPANISRAVSNAKEVKGRDCTIFMQFFDDDFTLLDDPYAIALLKMDVLRVKASGPSTRTVELSAESIWAQRSTAPWGFLSDRSQQSRYPGDNGLDQVPSMTGRVVDWPLFTS